MRRRSLEAILSGVGGLVFGALGVLMLSGDDLPVPPPADTAWLALGIGLLGAAACIALALGPGRRARAERELVRTAVQTGGLPDLDDAVLHRALWERSVQLRARRWSWLALGAPQLLVVGSHLLSPAHHDSVYSQVFWALEIAFWIVLVIVWTARARWERPKVERLLDRLDERIALRADA